MDIDHDNAESFATPAEFCAWLEANHASAPELWLKMFKRASGIPSVTWEEAVIEALAWGWIDGLKKSHDEVAYFQRFTPRKAKSGWSKKNCGHVERLIAEGRMQAPGLEAVEAAKADGRWEVAYAGSSQMEIPREFLDALAADASAEAFFKTLNKANLFAIYHRLHTARTEPTRQKRTETILAMLARGEKFH
tara:strand:+ start:26397 stop:26972 length:576 start_codon:yes stop_codon:yes gene_type:complete